MFQHLWHFIYAAALAWVAHAQIVSRGNIFLQVGAQVDVRPFPSAQQAVSRSLAQVGNGEKEHFSIRGTFVQGATSSSKLPTTSDATVHVLRGNESTEETGAFDGLLGNKSVAVCSVGHLRTFTLPGVYSSLLSNVLKTAPGGGADLFMEGHLEGSPHRSTIPSPEIEGDAQVRTALEYLGPSLVHRQFHLSDCSALEAAWKNDGIQDRVCRDPDRSNNFLQIMWIDECFRQVRKSGKKYDLIVRTRPDVGAFMAIPWQNISWSRVSFMRLDVSHGSDFFFAMPMSLIDTWWDRVVRWYLEPAHEDGPDVKIFDTDPQMLHPVSLPVGLVRGLKGVGCPNGLTEEFQAVCQQVNEDGFCNKTIDA